jgi:hypothetical protein
MPAWRDGMQMTVKIVNVFDVNLDIDLPNHLSLIKLFDPNTMKKSKAAQKTP